jgi:hypothetical protein
MPEMHRNEAYAGPMAEKKQQRYSCSCEMAKGNCEEALSGKIVASLESEFCSQHKPAFPHSSYAGRKRRTQDAK